MPWIGEIIGAASAKNNYDKLKPDRRVAWPPRTTTGTSTMRRFGFFPSSRIRPRFEADHVPVCIAQHRVSFPYPRRRDRPILKSDSKVPSSSYPLRPAPQLLPDLCRGCDRVSRSIWMIPPCRRLDHTSVRSSDSVRSGKPGSPSTARGQDAALVESRIQAQSSIMRQTKGSILSESCDSRYDWCPQ